MAEKFRYSIQKKDNVTYVKVSGIIDEDNKLQELGEKLGGGLIVIDLAEVERINSCGVRDWVTWLGKVEEKGAQLILVKASPAIVAQMNLVNNFTGNAIIASFYAPYYCNNCDKEKLYYIDALPMKEQGAMEAPKVRCDECDHLMEFDDMEESYFAFLRHVRIEPIRAILPDDWEQFFSVDETSARLINRERTPTLNKLNLKSNPDVSLPSFASLPSLRERTGSGTSRPTGSIKTINSSSRDSSTFGGPVATSPSQVSMPTSGSDSGAKKGMDKKVIILIVVAVILFIATLVLLIMALNSDDKTPSVQPSPTVSFISPTQPFSFLPSPCKTALLS